MLTWHPALHSSCVANQQTNGPCSPSSTPPVHVALEKCQLLKAWWFQTTGCSSPPAPSLSQIKHPVTGGDGFEPCAPMAPGAQECTLQYFADKGIADQVVPPTITMRDFFKVLERARPTVSPKDLEVRPWQQASRQDG